MGGQRFHLVHGYPGEGHETRIWGRVEPDNRSPFPDTICIVGHTPTVFLTDGHDEDFSIWHGDGILDIDCGCGSMKAAHRRLACLRLDDMAEFYVGGSGCGERGSLPAEEMEPLDEQDLPASLQRDLDAYQKGLAEHVPYLDCLWCELYGSINSAQWSGEISEDQARCLREKYLF